MTDDSHTHSGVITEWGDTDPYASATHYFKELDVTQQAMFLLSRLTDHVQDGGPIEGFRRAYLEGMVSLTQEALAVEKGPTPVTPDTPKGTPITRDYDKCERWFLADIDGTHFAYTYYNSWRELSVQRAAYLPDDHPWRVVEDER